LLICLLAKDFKRFKSIVAPHVGQGRSAGDDSSFAFIDKMVHSLLDNDTSAHTINGCDMVSLTHFISEKQWVELDD
jgi:hypothetical protein